MSAYSLNDKEKKKLKKFYDKHYNRGCREIYEHVTFICTGIGIAVRVKCPVCKKKKDISDYDSW